MFQFSPHRKTPLEVNPTFIRLSLSIPIIRVRSEGVYGSENVDDVGLRFDGLVSVGFADFVLDLLNLFKHRLLLLS